MFRQNNNKKKLISLKRASFGFVYHFLILSLTDASGGEVNFRFSYKQNFFYIKLKRKQNRKMCKQRRGLRNACLDFVSIRFCPINRIKVQKTKHTKLSWPVIHCYFSRACVCRDEIIGLVTQKCFEPQ